MRDEWDKMDKVAVKLRSPIKSSKKRPDIQYIRCIAIAAVLGFHIRPSVVPQGYLGVDIFFVISGYLMTLILNFHSNKCLSFQSIITFYERRLKRLLPAYLIIIFLTLFINGFCLISLDYDFLRVDALWATLFSTNLQSIFEKKTYFNLISDYKFLLHTWSLSVELQYYLIAPFLTYFIHKSGYQLILTTNVIFVSLLFQICTYEYEAVSFGAVFSRIWQFLIGTFVYYYEKKDCQEIQRPDYSMNFLEDGKNELVNKYPEEKQSNKSESHLLRIFIFSLLIIITFMPKLSESFSYTMLMRFISTVLTGIAMYYRWDHKANFITKILVYFGDISYSVYLVHWPVIILAKYLLLFDHWSLTHLFTLIMTLSVLQYELFERKLLRASNKLVFGACLILFIGIGILETQVQGLGYINSVPTHPSVAANQLIAANCNPQVDDLVKCNWDPEIMDGIVKKPKKAGAFYCSYDGPGKATVYFTGNSFALRQLPGIKKAFEGKYKKLYFIARPACLTFEVFNVGYDKYWQCDEIMNKTQVFLERLKPDIMIITQKMAGNKIFAGNMSIEASKETKAAKIMANYFEKFSEHVKKIFVIEPHPTLNYNPPSTLAKLVSQGKSIDDKFIKMTNVEKEVGPGWNKVIAAMENCTICEPIHIRDKYCSNTSCPVFDKKTKLSLYCDNSHLSQPGVEKMVPILKTYFNEALKELGKANHQYII